MISSFEDNSGNKPNAFNPRSLLRSIERAMASKSIKPVDRAQDLYYEAMEATSEEDKVRLLQDALKLDAGNVDVLLALMPYEAFLPGEDIVFLQHFVKLAETRLGPKAFQELAGAFWGFHETRPYMRARAQLAEALHQAGRLEEAITEWNAMLKLNPCDNQGVRYMLLPTALMLNRMEEARTIFEKYPQEFNYNAVFAWGRVLERFLSDALPEAKAALSVARKQNPHMESYVKGRRKIPKTSPESYAPGSREEAICFAEVMSAAWKKHPAALKWLMAQTAK